MHTPSELHTFAVLGIVEAFKQYVFVETYIAINIAGGCTDIFHALVDERAI